MAITVQTTRNPDRSDTPFSEVAGQTNGNETIFILDPEKKTFVEFIVTSAGEGTAKFSTQSDTPTDFTEFSEDSGGARTASFASSLEAGLRWIGLDIASGTWTVRVSQVL